MFSLLCFVDSKAPIHDYPLMVFYRSRNHLRSESEINGRNDQNFLLSQVMDRSIIIKEKIEKVRLSQLSCWRSYWLNMQKELEASRAIFLYYGFIVRPRKNFLSLFRGNLRSKRDSRLALIPEERLHDNTTLTVVLDRGDICRDALPDFKPWKYDSKYWD